MITLALSAKTLYVQSGSTGNGESWQNAMGNLQNALQMAHFGDEIWVAKGIYHPTKGSDRTIAFHIKNGIALYGGFYGNEKKLEDRNVDHNLTVLSGEIGTHLKTDNTYNVIITRHVTKATIVDGFTITGGYAGDNKTGGSRFSSGAGWYNHAYNFGKYASPTIRNCHFVENTARDGAAMYNNSVNGSVCQPQLVHCRFNDNKAFLGGGAIFNKGQENGKCQPTIQKCAFSNNQAGYGGAIFNLSKSGTCLPEFFECTFQSNQATFQGGGLFNLALTGNCKADLVNCEFDQNHAPKGSSIANSYGTSAIHYSRLSITTKNI